MLFFVTLFWLYDFFFEKKYFLTLKTLSWIIFLIFFEKKWNKLGWGPMWIMSNRENNVVDKRFDWFLRYFIYLSSATLSETSFLSHFFEICYFESKKMLKILIFCINRLEDVKIGLQQGNRIFFFGIPPKLWPN